MSDTKYSLLVQPRFENEVDEALEYYQEISPQVRKAFNNQLLACFQALSQNPFYQVRYKEVRAIPVKRFPYVLFFKIVENSRKVMLLSCFQANQSPLKNPKI
ncbi:MAG: type II toxin-antitoxin system RelE/ParE family toxin [Nonlabens sp.]|uniref:type II toxin-antitoxin system RelE/ParE family toxin n=1 Tax=Nonlabens sp. TaxID=1888209 RepID=UPI003EF93CA9